MSSFVADPTEGPLSSIHASTPGPCAATPANELNQESLSNEGPNEAPVSGLQPSFVGEATCNDPSDIKAYPTNINTESDANHEEISPLGVSATKIIAPGKSATEGNSFPDTPPRMTSPPPTSQEVSVKVENFPTGESDTPTSNETTLPTLAEEHKDISSFDIFDSDDHETSGNGRRHSIGSQDGSIFIGNGLASPKHCGASPSPDGHLVTPAPKKMASLLTPPPSEEKTSVTSISLQEIGPDASSSEKNLFTLPQEENPNGDVHTLESNDLPGLPHEALGQAPPTAYGADKKKDDDDDDDDRFQDPENEAGHNGNIYTSEQNDLSTLSREESRSGDITPFEDQSYSTSPRNNCDGNLHTLELGDPSALSHGSHSGHAIQSESEHPTLPQSNCDGDIHTSEQNHLSTPLREGNHSDDVTQFEENDHSTLPPENCDGAVHTLKQDNLSTVSREGNYNGDGAGFEENGYSTIPYENYDGDVHTLEPKDLSTLPQENSNGGVSPLEGNAHFTLPHEEIHGGDVTPFEDNYHSPLPHKESYYGDAHTPDKTPREPYDASKATNIKEQNSGRQPRGDYWRPSITESRVHSRYGDSYRRRETGGSSHQFGSSARHLGDLGYRGSERDRRPRSRSPARDIKRGRIRDISPPRRNSGSRDGPYGLSGSNASHQTEDRSSWHRFGNQTFKGDRYTPLSGPTRPARRSPAPSPGRELTPPRRTPRNRSRSRSPPPTLPKRQSSRQPEYTSRKVHPTRSSSALPDQSTAFQNSIRSANTGRRHGAGSAFEGGHSADMRNSDYVQARIPTSPKRPEKRRRHEDEAPAQNKRYRRDEQAHNGGRM
ncbi:hypothetical protein B9Z19DRAFT_1106160, partial [Tuber borchii]